MKITRRNFVQALGTSMAIAVSGVGVNSTFGLATSEGAGFNGSGANSLFKMTSAELKHFIGRRFVANSADGRRVDLVLAEVNNVSRPANSKRGYSGECFSVVFKGSAKEEFDQGIYEMKSAGVDGFSALLVPTSRGRREFEMVVNRLAR
jgi:hypothetical protein